MTNKSIEALGFLLCSDCFVDEGLRIDAWKYGTEHEIECPNCKSLEGRKLTKEDVLHIADRFFVLGTTIRYDYGAAPGIQFNEHHYRKSDISPSRWLRKDIRRLEEAGKIGFFHYGLRFWMFGEIEPLKALQDPETRHAIIQRVLHEYPERTLGKGMHFYRVRVNPCDPKEVHKFDSPPRHLSGKGRLDSPDLQVMYGSQDLDICIHECRATADDEMYVATLQPTRDLRLLDLTGVLKENVTRSRHPYAVSRKVALV